MIENADQLRRAKRWMQVFRGDARALEAAGPQAGEEPRLLALEVASLRSQAERLEQQIVEYEAQQQQPAV